MPNITDKPKFLAVDFYCGAGGTTRGLLDAGGYVIAGIDKDDGCRITYARNNRNETLDRKYPRFLALDMFPSSLEYPQGQQQEVWDKLNELIPEYRKRAPSVPLLFAICAPCQSFTKFVQSNISDERKEDRRRSQDLLAQTVAFIEKFKPDMVISENVASIVTGKYQHIWTDFQEDLRNHGYAVGAGRVCASKFGVPQRRRRSVIIANKDKDKSESLLNLLVPQQDPDAKDMSVLDAIDHLPPLETGGKDESVPNHICRNLIDINRQRLMSVEPGESNYGFAEIKYKDGDLSLPCHRRLDEKGKRGFGDVYTRMRPDRPSPTITTRFLSISNGRFGHYDTKQVRGLSLREGAALQSFPDDYKFYSKGMDTIARMIGNAVPPKLSAYMADWLLGLWRDKESIAT
jgi:DNA (cytosine-5)-methyltransferase 1